MTLAGPRGGRVAYKLSWSARGISAAVRRTIGMQVSSVVSKNSRRFYIDGAWVDPIGRGRWEVVDPATEEPVAEIALGSAADVDRAVAAARAAFPAFAGTSRKERLDLLKRIFDAYQARYNEFAS